MYYLPFENQLQCATKAILLGNSLWNMGAYAPAFRKNILVCEKNSNFFGAYNLTFYVRTTSFAKK